MTAALEPRSGLLRQCVAWSGVALALALLAQVAWLGLRPAVAERRRLAEAEQQLRARVEREEREAAELERVERAQNDPIFLERERRALRSDTPRASDSNEADSTEAPDGAASNDPSRPSTGSGAGDAAVPPPGGAADSRSDAPPPAPGSNAPTQDR